MDCLQKGKKEWGNLQELITKRVKNEHGHQTGGFHEEKPINFM